MFRFKMSVYLLLAAALGTLPGVTSQSGLDIHGVFSVHQSSTPGQQQCSMEINEPESLLYEAFLWRVQTNASGLVDICDNSLRLQSMIEQPANNGEMIAYVGPSDGQFIDAAVKSYVKMEQVGVLTSWSVPDYSSQQHRFVHSIAPSVIEEADAMIDVIRSQSWTDVVLVYVDNRYGQNGLVRFTSKAAENSITISKIVRMGVGMNDGELNASIAEIREASSTKILAVFAYVSHIEHIWDVLRKSFVFISPVSFGEHLYRNPSKLANYTGMVSLRAGFDDAAINQIHTNFINRIALPNTNELLLSFWEHRLQCNLPNGTNTYPENCSGQNYTLTNLPIPTELPLVYVATESLVAAASDTCTDGNMQCREKTAAVQDIFLSSTTSSIAKSKKSLLQGTTGEAGIKVIVVDKNGIQQVKTTSSDRTIIQFYNAESDSWITVFKQPVPREVIGVRDDDEWGLRYDFYKHGWAIALAVFAALGIIGTIALVIAYTIFLKNIPMVALHFVLLAGLFLGFLTLFAFLPLPTKATCGIIRFGVGFSYAICFSALLLIALYWVQGKRELSRYRMILAFIGFLAVGIELAILIMWLIMVEPMAVQIMANSGKMVWICNHYTSDINVWKLFERTGFENHLLALIYIMLLIFVILLLALWGLFAGKGDRKHFLKKHIISLVILIAGVIIIWLIWTLTGGLLYEADYAHEIADGCLGFGLFLTLLWIMIAYIIPVLLIYRRGERVDYKSHREYGIEDNKGMNGGPRIISPYGENHQIHHASQDITLERNARPHILETQDPANYRFQEQGASMSYGSDDGHLATHAKHMSRSAVELPRVSDNVDSRYIEHRGQIYHPNSQPNAMLHHRSAGDLAYTSRRQTARSEGGFEYDTRSNHIRHPRSMVDGGGSIITVPADSGQTLMHETSFAQSEPPVFVTDRHHGAFNPMYAGRSAASIYSAPNTVYYQQRPAESMYSQGRLVSSNDGLRYFRPVSESEYGRRKHRKVYHRTGPL